METLEPDGLKVDRNRPSQSRWKQSLLGIALLVLIGPNGVVVADSAGGAEAQLARGSEANASTAPSAPDPSAPDPSASEQRTSEQRLADLEARCRSAEQERLRQSEENARLNERLTQTGAFMSLSGQIEKQTALLSRLAEQLGLGPELTGERAGQDADGVAIVDENARLRAELEVSERRLGLLMEQFAQAHKLRLDALADAAAAREQSAELDARLRQRQQAADEAQMRADKAEKLYAALEEAHIRVSTESERLSRDLATARERQAEAMQRVVELDSLLAGSEAREVQITTSSEPSMGKVSGPSTPTSVPSDAIGGSGPGPAAVAVYQVRAEDTLSRISAAVYGDASAWPRIFEANREQLATPDDLALGMSLIIP